MGLAGIIGLLSLGALVFGGYAALVQAGANSTDAGRRAVWAQLAEKRGGEYLDEKRPFWSTERRDQLDLRVGSAVVRVDVRITGFGKSKEAYTRARARFTLGRGPAFHVAPAGALASVGRALGAQDLPLGHQRFDRDFIVKGQDHAGVKRAWTPALQATLTRSLSDATVTSRGDMVELSLSGARYFGVDVMADVVGALASVGADALDALAAALPDATLTRAGGTWDAPTPPSLTVPTAQGDVTALVCWFTGGPRVILALPVTRELPEFRVVIADGHAEGIPQGLLSEYGARLLVELPGVLVASKERHLELRWLGIPEASTFMCGVNLLAELAGRVHHTGAFR